MSITEIFGDRALREADAAIKAAAEALIDGVLSAKSPTIGHGKAVTSCLHGSLPRIERSYHDLPI